MTPADTFEQHAHDIYGWAYRVLGRHHDALDVVQDVFLKWSAQCDTKPPDSPRGWLRRVTVNRAVDAFRRSREQPAAAETMLRLVPASGDVSGAANRSELRADIAAALDDLTEHQRAVLVAKVYDGLTFAEIAAELDVAVPTVKTHYLRALRAVREKLSPRWAEKE